MTRSITSVGTFLGAAALTLTVGCSRGNRPAQQPITGTTSPTFESNVPPGAEPGAMGQPGATGDQGAPSQPGDRRGEAEMGAGVQPPSMGEPGAAPRPPETSNAPASEHDLCDALAAGAKLHIEDVQNGVAIVAMPKPGTSLSTVRDDTRRIERSISQPSNAGPKAPEEACAVFSLARMPSVTTTVNEGAGAMRIVMTTTNPTEVKDLRRGARDQVNAMTKATPGARPYEAPKQPAERPR